MKREKVGSKPRKLLLNLDEFCDSMGLKKCKATELLRSPECTYSVKIGRSWYADLAKLTKWVDSQSDQSFYF